MLRSPAVDLNPLTEKQREKLAKLQGIEKPKTTKPKKKDLLVVGEEAPAFEKQMSDSLGSYYERLMKKHGTDYAVCIYRTAYPNHCRRNPLARLR